MPPKPLPTIDPELEKIQKYFRYLSADDLDGKIARSRFLDYSGKHETVQIPVNFQRILGNYRSAYQSIQKGQNKHKPVDTSDFQKLLEKFVFFDPAKNNFKTPDLFRTFSVKDFKAFLDFISGKFDESIESQSPPMELDGNVLGSESRSHQQPAPVSPVVNITTASPRAHFQPRFFDSVIASSSQQKDPINQLSADVKGLETSLQMFKHIYNKPIDPNVNPSFIHYLDIWRPQNTYQAIMNNEAWTSDVKISNLLHHFRICLDILHLIIFRLDSKVNREYTYANILETNNELSFPKDIPLIVYAGWSPRIPLNTKSRYLTDLGGIQLLNLDFGDIGVEHNTYSEYYKHIDNAFIDPSQKNNRIDTFAEVICLIFSVNYKYFCHKNNKQFSKSDRYHPSQISIGIPTMIGKLLAQPVRDGVGMWGTSITQPVSFQLRQTAIGTQRRPPVRLSPLALPVSPSAPEAPLDESRKITETSNSLSASARKQFTDRGREGPPVTLNSIYCYITDEDIENELRPRYEKHCILIVHTLMAYGQTSFRVTDPKKPVFNKDLKH